VGVALASLSCFESVFSYALSSLMASLVAGSETAMGFMNFIGGGDLSKSGASLSAVSGVVVVAAGIVGIAALFTWSRLPARDRAPETWLLVQPLITARLVLLATNHGTDLPFLKDAALHANFVFWFAMLAAALRRPILAFVLVSALAWSSSWMPMFPAALGDESLWYHKVFSISDRARDGALGSMVASFVISVVIIVLNVRQIRAAASSRRENAPDPIGA
jgi:hypothetical protein